MYSCQLYQMTCLLSTRLYSGLYSCCSRAIILQGVNYIPYEALLRHNTPMFFVLKMPNTHSTRKPICDIEIDIFLHFNRQYICFGRTRQPLSQSVVMILLSTGGLGLSIHPSPPSAVWVWWAIWNYSVHGLLGSRMRDASRRHSLTDHTDDITPSYDCWEVVALISAGSG